MKKSSFIFKILLIYLVILSTGCSKKPRLVKKKISKRIKVGIMSGMEKISFSPTDGIEISYGKKKVHLRKNKIYSIRRINGAPSTNRYYLVLKTLLPQEDKITSLEKLRREFPGAATFVRGVNAPYGDNRRTLITLPPVNDRKTAEKKRGELERRKIFTWILPVMDKPPGIKMSLYAGKNLIMSGLSSLEIESETYPVIVRRVEYGKGYSWHGYEDRRYRGKLTFGADNRGKLLLTLSLPLENYVEGILPYEMPSKAPLEALKAQAVAARTETLSKLGHRHLDEQFDICSTQHCQVFGGDNRLSDTIIRAVVETKGIIMVDPETHYIQDTRYSANCGGHTEHNDNTWNLPPDQHLRGVPDTIESTSMDLREENNFKKWLKMNPQNFYCGDTTFTKPEKFRWEVEYSSSELNRMINRKYKIGNLKDVRLLERGVSGRLKHIRVIGTKNKIDIRGELNIRRLFNNLKSSAFILSASRNKRGKITRLKFTGAGWGHGVGMCQVGAMSRANRGQSYTEILKHYYKGVSLRNITN